MSRNLGRNTDIWLLDLVHDGALSRFTTEPTLDSNPAWLRQGTELLWSKGIPHDLDMWGHDVDHDWPWWRKMLPYALGKLL